MIAEMAMAKRTNRVAWGLVVLVMLLLIGGAVGIYQSRRVVVVGRYTIYPVPIGEWSFHKVAGYDSNRRHVITRRTRLLFVEVRTRLLFDDMRRMDTEPLGQ
jgi:hypothetical protein